MSNDTTNDDDLPSDRPEARLPSDYFQRLPSEESPREIRLPSETFIRLPSDIPAPAQRGS
mgnify:CR=1 FL=1